MSRREFGNAQYKAFRSGDTVKVIATGTAPGMNVKTDIEQLPFLISPPVFGFYFVIPEIILHALRPFTYEEDVSFPRSANFITIFDANGQHRIAIEELVTPAPQPALPDSSDNGYCVFSWIGTDSLKIAKCDAILPAVYSRIFGPATFGECNSYIQNNTNQ